MRPNPCYDCEESVVWQNRHYPRHIALCKLCKKRMKYEADLQSKRKYEAGDPIGTLGDLLEQKWVIWNGSTKNIEIVKSLQLRTVLQLLERGMFKKAIRKGE